MSSRGRATFLEIKCMHSFPTCQFSFLSFRCNRKTFSCITMKMGRIVLFTMLLDEAMAQNTTSPPEVVRTIMPNPVSPMTTAGPVTAPHLGPMTASPFLANNGTQSDHPSGIVAFSTLQPTESLGDPSSNANGGIGFVCSFVSAVSLFAGYSVC